MKNPKHWLLVWITASLLLTLPGSRLSAGLADTPIRDDDGNEIGRFEEWRKVRVGGRRMPEPRGWVGLLNGSLGLSLFTKVEREGGFAVKGSVRRKTLHGRKVHFQPMLSAGEFDRNNTQLGGATGVPVSERHGSLRGLYRFKPIQGSSLQVRVELFQGQDHVGQGRFSTKEQVNEWTPFTASINYFGESVPDRAFIIIDILGRQNGNEFKPAVQGTYYFLDELVFSD